MKGLVLVDVPEHGLRCGEYVDLAEDIGETLAADGRLDTQAPDPAAPQTPGSPVDAALSGQAPSGAEGQQSDLLGGDELKPQASDPDAKE